MFESKNDVRWYQQSGDGNKAGFYRLSTGNVPSDMFEMLLETSGHTFLPFFYGKCRIETRNGNIEQLKNLNEAPSAAGSSRDKLVKAIEQRLLKALIGRRLLNPIVKRSDEKQVLVPGFGRPITKKDCLTLAQSFDDWKAVNHRNIDRDAPILDALPRLLDPSDEKLGINVDIPDDAVEYRPRGLYEEDEVEEDEYRRPKNQPHNLHRVDEKNAPTEYHNDFGSDLLACAKGMNDHDFNSAHVGVWSGFGFHAVVPVGFSGSHVTLEPSDDNMLTLPQFLNGLKKIGIKKLSDVKTLDIYGEDSEYAGFEWDRNSIMKVICLKFSSKNNTPNPKDMLKDFMSEEDSKNEFEGESEELNESMVRFCDRLIRG